MLSAVIRLLSNLICGNKFYCFVFVSRMLFFSFLGGNCVQGLHLLPSFIVHRSTLQVAGILVVLYADIFRSPLKIWWVLIKTFTSSQNLDRNPSSDSLACLSFTVFQNSCTFKKKKDSYCLSHIELAYHYCNGSVCLQLYLANYSHISVSGHLY